MTKIEHIKLTQKLTKEWLKKNKVTQVTHEMIIKRKLKRTKEKYI